MDQLYTCEEVAKRYGVKLVTVWNWIRKKRLSALKIGKMYRVSESDLILFEQCRRTVPK